MLKTISNMFIGGLIVAIMGSALATVGTPPVSGGPALVDGTWLNGLAGGQNLSYQYAISAAGTTQATATQLPSGIALIEVDTVGSSAGVALPFCYQGTEFKVYNNGANTLTFYPGVTNNPITAAQDTINNATTATASTHTSKLFYCAKNGNWAAQ